MVKLVNSLSRLGRAKVLVLGDLVLDTYTIGKARRISPEAPVAVINVEKESSLPGGAGNTALNLKSLGADVMLVGRIGQDSAGELLKNCLENENVSTQWIVVQDNYKTPVKNRVIAENQQIVRVDHEKFVALSESLEQYLIDSLPLITQDVKVVAFSDYGKGFLTPDLLQAVIQYANSKGIIVITDPKGQDFSKYEGTTVIKPNQSEAYAAANLPSTFSLDIAAQRILQHTQAKMLMVTRSEAGISLFHANGQRQDFPVHAKEVKDVTGAGDTVLAMLAHALANDLKYEEAAELCNVAAGIAIEHFGCARVTLADLAQRLLDKNITHKIFDEEHLFVLQEVLKDKNYALLVIPNLQAFTSSLFHALQKLAQQFSALLIYISDPNPYESAVDILVSLREVSFILIHSDNLKEACQHFKPTEIYIFENQQLTAISSFSNIA